jgi:predicted transcriptional regulator
LAASVLRLVDELMPTVEGIVDTSMEAYQQKEAEGSLYSDRVKILALIDEFGGVAIWEAAKHLNRPDSDISSRFRDLEKARIIEKSQTVFKVNPRTKKRAHVWVRRRKEAA